MCIYTHTCMQASLHPCKHACARTHTHTLANKQGAKEPIDSYLRVTSNLNEVEDAQSGLSSHGCQIQPGTQADTHILTPADTSFRWCVLPSSVLLILRTEHEQPHQERAALRKCAFFRRGVLEAIGSGTRHLQRCSVLECTESPRQAQPLGR